MPAGTPGSVLLTSYGTLRRDAEAVRKLALGMVLIDEAQAIKNAGSATSKAVKSLKAPMRLALSGAQSPLFHGGPQPQIFAPRDDTLLSTWHAKPPHLLCSTGMRGGQRVVMTAALHACAGTPVENKLAELHSIIDFALPGYLGTPKQFAADFGKPIEQNRDAERMECLKRITAPFLLRRLKTDRAIIADLPDKARPALALHDSCGS
jgi:hypothetical protein